MGQILLLQTGYRALSTCVCLCVCSILPSVRPAWLLQIQRRGEQNSSVVSVTDTHATFLFNKHD